jgi:hypothetical protein
MVMIIFSIILGLLILWLVVNGFFIMRDKDKKDKDEGDKGDGH